jgi:formate--tetrahydrofolate ligase
VVASLPSLRFHGGAADPRAPGADLKALELGLANLEQHLAILATFGIPVVVAINRFPGDRPEETARVVAFCREHGVTAMEHTLFSDGAEGGRALADAVAAATALGKHSHPLLPPGTDPMAQVEAIVTRIYGGAGAVWTEEAKAELAELGRLGELGGPVCLAKTPLSISDDPKKRGRPIGFTVQVRHVDRSAGAGFTVVRLGAVETMPGLPEHPSSERIDLAADGTILGLD